MALSKPAVATANPAVLNQLIAKRRGPTQRRFDPNTRVAAATEIARQRDLSKRAGGQRQPQRFGYLSMFPTTSAREPF